MLRRRRQLRVLVILLSGVVSLNYLSPFYMPDHSEFDQRRSGVVMMTPMVATELKRSVVNTRERIKFNVTSANNSRQLTTSVVVKPSKIAENVTTERVIYSDGYNLSQRASNMCKGPKRMPGYVLKWKQLRLHAVYETYDKALQLCPVWKAGTTFIRRLFIIKNREDYKSYRNPYNISFFDNDTLTSKLIVSSEKIKRFIFVRNPYSRIFSFYVDKLIAPNPYYWNAVGTRGIYLFRPHPSRHSRICGHDITFTEYVKYITAALSYKTAGAQVDPHFLPIYQLCQPCTVRYDFIGKLETFQRDYPVLVKELNLTQSGEILDMLEHNGSELAAFDAIQDTVESALTYEFRARLNACIPFSEVLQRIWWKLQLRGLISPSPPPKLLEKISNITVTELVELAKASRKNSTAEERKAYQHKKFVEFFKQIDRGYLERLRIAYIYDFRLFEYNDKPAELFGNN